MKEPKFWDKSSMLIIGVLVSILAITIVLAYAFYLYQGSNPPGPENGESPSYMLFHGFLKLLHRL